MREREKRVLHLFGSVGLNSEENVIYNGSRYNPYVQARSRIDQLKRLGHSVDKVFIFSIFKYLLSFYGIEFYRLIRT